MIILVRGTFMLRYVDLPGALLLLLLLEELLLLLRVLRLLACLLVDTPPVAVVGMGCVGGCGWVGA